MDRGQPFAAPAIKYFLKHFIAKAVSRLVCKIIQTQALHFTIQMDN